MIALEPMFIAPVPVIAPEVRVLKLAVVEKRLVEKKLVEVA